MEKQFDLKKFLTENKLTTNSRMLNEAFDADQFKQFQADLTKGTPIKAKIKVNGQEGVITLTGLKSEGSLKYTGVLDDNGGIQAIEVLKGQKVKLSNFPTTSEYGNIGNTTGKEELKTSVGMKDSIIFTFEEFV